MSLALENRGIPIVSLASQNSTLAVVDERIMFRDRELLKLSLEMYNLRLVVIWQDCQEVEFGLYDLKGLF